MSHLLPHHCSRRRLCSEGPIKWEYGGFGSPPFYRGPSYVGGQGCCSAARSSPPPSTGTPAPRVPGNPGHTSLHKPPPKGTLWGERAFLRKRGVKVGGVGERVTKKKLWLGQECAWVNQSQASCHIHSCAGQGGVQGAGGARSPSGQDTRRQPALGGQAGSLPAAWSRRSWASTWARCQDTGFCHPNLFTSLGLSFPNRAMTRFGVMLKQGNFLVKNQLNKVGDGHTF